MDNIVILRSVYGKVGQKYFITPCKDPKTGRFPNCVRLVYSNGDMILSDKSIDNLPHAKKHRTYAVTNFRGGIGKTTLSFNLAYAMCKNYMTLFLDVCPQQNFTSLFSNNFLISSKSKANPSKLRIYKSSFVYR